MSADTDPQFSRMFRYGDSAKTTVREIYGPSSFPASECAARAIDPAYVQPYNATADEAWTDRTLVSLEGFIPLYNMDPNGDDVEAGKDNTGRTPYKTFSALFGRVWEDGFSQNELTVPMAAGVYTDFNIPCNTRLNFKGVGSTTVIRGLCNVQEDVTCMLDNLRIEADPAKQFANVYVAGPNTRLYLKDIEHAGTGIDYAIYAMRSSTVETLGINRVITPMKGFCAIYMGSIYVHWLGAQAIVEAVDPNEYVMFGCFNGGSLMQIRGTATCAVPFKQSFRVIDGTIFGLSNTPRGTEDPAQEKWGEGRVHITAYV